MGTTRLLCAILALTFALAGCGRSELDFPEDVPPSPDVNDNPDLVTPDVPDVPIVPDVPDVPDVPQCMSNLNCDDNVFCNGQELCVEGRCLPGSRRCDDGVACTLDRCDEGARRCVSTPNDGLCPPGNRCDAVTGCTPPVGCTSDRACDDGDSCTVDRCDPMRRTCLRTWVDNDSDGVPPLRCAAGRDCDDNNPRVSPLVPEVCGDGLDNDCNGLADCSDRVCAGTPACCRPSGAEDNLRACADGVDNDCDGVTDCNDMGCVPTAACCRPTGREVCNDGRDNDCNGVADCSDRACLTSPLCCRPTGTEDNAMACADGRDNDCDGVADCNDPGCAALPACCRPTGREVCTDGRDNDCDGFTDCLDFECVGVPPTCVVRPPNDTCAAPTRVLVPSTTRGITTNALNDFTPTTGAAGCFGGAGPDVVYTFSVTSTQSLILDTVGSSFDTVLYVRSANCLTGAQVACNDDTSGLASEVRFTATPGTYYVFVDGFNESASGEFVLNLRLGAPPEVCNNLVDDDRDGFADCRDPDCARDPACVCTPTAAETTAATCVDGRDNDCDGFTDCNDTGCVNVPACCRPTGREVCNDGRDNDCNGLLDCADRACAGTLACCRPTGPEASAATCVDSLDNDCDGLVDCADTACQALPVCCRPTAAAERGVAACSDGRDNDCDGVSDCNDPDCRLTSDPNAECCNGRDDNRNGVIDEFACVCASNAQCAGVGAGGTFPSNTCWTTTFGVCAPRCTVLGGQAFCDAFFRGSRCNTATGECVR
jgi:hypothetical protein